MIVLKKNYTSYTVCVLTAYDCYIIQCVNFVWLSHIYSVNFVWLSHIYSVNFVWLSHIQCVNFVWLWHIQCTKITHVSLFGWLICLSGKVFVVVVARLHIGWQPPVEFYTCLHFSWPWPTVKVTGEPAIRDDGFCFPSRFECESIGSWLFWKIVFQIKQTLNTTMHSDHKLTSLILTFNLFFGTF